ncbi:MAG: hypothetical protein ACSHX8_12015 [Opitutaceae bacterium]
MPYTIEWNQDGLIWTYTGIITGQELIQSNMDVYGEPRFDEIHYQIVNMLQVTENLVTDADMRKVAYLDMAAARTNPKIRVAVIQADELAQGYENHTTENHWPTHSFTDLASAKEWATSRE